MRSSGNGRPRCEEARLLIAQRFDEMLAGGKPNSLGPTVQVVDLVLADRARLGELFDAYGSDDELVRLRVSSALKRVCAAQ